MLKRKISVLFALLVLFALVGCGADKTVSESKDDVSSAESLTEDIYPLVDDTYDNKDGIPPLNDNLKQLFSDSMKIYYALTVSGGESLSFDGIDGYYTVDEYTDKAQLEKDLHKCFTDNFCEKVLKAYFDNCIEKNGAVYCRDPETVEQSGYFGHCFEIGEIYETEINLTAKIFLDFDNPKDSMFYMPNGGAGENAIEERAFVIEKQENGWRFSEFSRLY